MCLQTPCSNHHVLAAVVQPHVSVLLIADAKCVSFFLLLQRFLSLQIAAMYLVLSMYLLRLPSLPTAVVQPQVGLVRALHCR
jgi:hypothetical protein